jgi:hypothetical protein
MICTEPASRRRHFGAARILSVMRDCEMLSRRFSLLCAILSAVGRGAGTCGDPGPCRVRTVMLRRRSRGSAPAVRQCAALRQGNRHPARSGASLAAGGVPAVRRAPCGGLWHESAAGRYSWLSGPSCANTRATQVRVREGSNTRVTRTTRHSPAHLGTGVKIDMSARLPG